jgi:hypothetical protein
MGKKDKRLLSVSEPPGTVLRLRAGAGRYAVAAGEAEVRIDGARIAGGAGAFEFDLFSEAWIEIHIIRS